MLDYRQVERGRCDQSLAHDLVVEDGLAIIAQGHGPGALEGREVGELFTAAANGRSSNGEDIYVSAASGIKHPARDFRRVVHRVGIRHGADGGKSSGSRGHGAAGDGLFVRLTGLAEMDMNIDEAGSDDEAASVERVVGFTAQFAGGSDLNHAAIFEQKIVLALKMLSGIDEETV